MPRKKLDPAAEILAYFADTSYDVALVVLGLVKAQMLKRAPAVEKKAIVRRRRKQEPAPVVAVIDQEKFLAPTTTSGPNSAVPVPVAPKPRKRRMRADSPRPTNEATPIVPQQAEVGEEERAARAAQVDEAENELEAYTGQ